MGDLNTPPPSYDIVMGTPATSTHSNQSYRPMMRPSAPPGDNDIVSARITAPIQPRWSRPYTSPTHSPTIYSPSRPMEQNNNLRRQDSNDNEMQMCTCVAMALLTLGAIAFLLVQVAREGSSTDSFTDRSYSDNG